MDTAISPAQVERLRRDAKRLRRQECIPLHEAQDRLAVARGFKNWSQLVKHSAKKPQVGSAPPAPPSSHAPLLPRYYLHGDQSETEPVKYYCAQCDSFEEAPHFETAHPFDSVVERYERNMKWWYGPENTTKLRYRRTDSALNLLGPLVKAFQANVAAMEKLNSAFYQWLETQTQRNDPIGDLAKDIVGDKGFPRQAQSLAKLVDYLNSRGAIPEAVARLKAAHKAFKKTQS